MPGSQKDTFKETYKAIKVKISEIEKVKDPGERYLKFVELRDNVSAAYDHDSVNMDITWKGGDYSWMTGMMSLALGVGAVIPLAMYANGKMRASKATKQANKMNGLERKIKKEIKSLSSKDNIKSLAASPHAEELAEKFPDLKAEFERCASVIEARQKITGKTIPAAEPAADKTAPAQASGPVL